MTFLSGLPLSADPDLDPVPVGVREARLGEAGADHGPRIDRVAPGRECLDEREAPARRPGRPQPTRRAARAVRGRPLGTEGSARRTEPAAALAALAEDRDLDPGHARHARLELLPPPARRVPRERAGAPTADIA